MSAPPEDLVEEPPATPGTAGLWALLLVGPIVWITHFMVVYLLAEAACAAEREGFAFLDAGALPGVVIGSTVVAGAVAAVACRWTWRTARAASGDRRLLAGAGSLLAAGAVLGILAVGLPALVLPPC